MYAKGARAQHIFGVLNQHTADVTPPLNNTIMDGMILGRSIRNPPEFKRELSICKQCVPGFLFTRTRAAGNEAIHNFEMNKGIGCNLN